MCLTKKIDFQIALLQNKILELQSKKSDFSKESQNKRLANFLHEYFSKDHLCDWNYKKWTEDGCKKKFLEKANLLLEKNNYEELVEILNILIEE